MYKPVKWITTIANQIVHTIYLYSRDESILIPIKTNIRNQKPRTLETLKLLLSIFEIKPIATKICLPETGSYHTQLAILKDDTVLDLNVSMEDGINLAQSLQLPIFIENTIFKLNGFHITKEIIQNALEHPIEKQS